MAGKLNKKVMKEEDLEEAYRDRVEELSNIPAAWDFLSDLINHYEQFTDEKSKKLVKMCYQAMESTHSSLHMANLRKLLSGPDSIATRTIDTLKKHSVNAFKTDPKLESKLNMTAGDLAHHVFLTLIQRPSAFDWAKSGQSTFLALCVKSSICDIIDHEIGNKKRANAIEVMRKSAHQLSKKEIASLTDLENRKNVDKKS